MSTTMGKMFSFLTDVFVLTIGLSRRFLTQTRPDVSSPEIYHIASPSQTLGSLHTFVSQSTQRHPLRTLSFASLPDSPETTPLKRLKKRDISPAQDEFKTVLHATSSPGTLRPKNAFDEMRIAQKRRATTDKKILEKSEFVEAEAEESDDDDQFGFGGHKRLDDEEDDEDLDKTAEGLVDDKVMDEETLAEDLVLQKVK